MKLTLSSPLRYLLAALALSIPWSASAAPVTPTVSVTHGLTSLLYNNGQYVSAPHGNDPRGSFDVSTRFDGDTALAYNGPTARALNGNVLIQTYSWGTAACTYAVSEDRISFQYTVINTSSRTLQAFKTHVLDLQFPSYEVPKSWSSSWVPGAWDQSAPQVLMASYNTGVLAVVQPDLDRAFQVYFTSRYYNGYPLNLVSLNPIAPGQSDQFQVQIRFGPPGVWNGDLAPDVLNAFERAHPQLNTWRDRRPIGQELLASVNRQWTNNPRGWLNDSSINVFTTAGLADFRTKMLNRANYDIGLAKGMNAQGIIFWDLEGEQYPQGISTYAGDPRLLSRLAPEMDAIADEFMARFTSQGLRVGLCIRAQQIVFRLDGSFYQQDWPVGNNDAVFADLDAKLNYARQRWGCTLFYVDSNSWPSNNTHDVSVFRRLQQKYPDVLICPEFHKLQYYTCCAPYLEMKNNGSAGTSATDYNVLPGAFSLINVADGNMSRTQELLNAIKRGDIMLYRAWYQNAEYTTIKTLYQQATAVPWPVVFANHYAAVPGAANVYDVTSNGFVLGAPQTTLRVLSTTNPAQGSAAIANNKLNYQAPASVGTSVTMTVKVAAGSTTVDVPIGAVTDTP